MENAGGEEKWGKLELTVGKLGAGRARRHPNEVKGGRGGGLGRGGANQGLEGKEIYVWEYLCVFLNSRVIRIIN